MWTPPRLASSDRSAALDDPKGPPKILIADDNPQNVELLEAYLADIECQTEVAVDGEDTLSKVESFGPDLLLLDVMMPRLSGFEVCRKLRAGEKTRDLMILMVTALNETADYDRGVQAGTDDFLSKPVNKVELLCRIRSLLRVRHLKNQLERTLAYLADFEAASRGVGTS
jgi:two-component system alkaline phosphatase synthesis response regulator PhoP